jgi:hypothetical protein
LRRGASRGRAAAPPAKPEPSGRIGESGKRRGPREARLPVPADGRLRGSDASPPARRHSALAEKTRGTGRTLPDAPRAARARAPQRGHAAHYAMVFPTCHQGRKAPAGPGRAPRRTPLDGRRAAVETRAKRGFLLENGPLRRAARPAPSRGRGRQRRRPRGSLGDRSSGRAPAASACPAAPAPPARPLCAASDRSVPASRPTRAPRPWHARAPSRKECLTWQTR